MGPYRFPLETDTDGCDANARIDVHESCSPASAIIAKGMKRRKRELHLEGVCIDTPVMVSDLDCYRRSSGIVWQDHEGGGK